MAQSQYAFHQIDSLLDLLQVYVVDIVEYDHEKTLSEFNDRLAFSFLS